MRRKYLNIILYLGTRQTPNFKLYLYGIDHFLKTTFFNILTKRHRLMLVSRQQRDQIWRNLTTFAKKSCLWQLFDSLFLIGQNIEPTLAKLVHYWANFIVANGQILKNNLTIRSHRLPTKMEHFRLRLLEIRFNECVTFLLGK